MSEPEYDGGESDRDVCLDRESSERALNDGIDRAEARLERALESDLEPDNCEESASAEYEGEGSDSVSSVLALSNGRHFLK